jgi:hypothetical protein
MPNTWVAWTFGFIIFNPRQISPANSRDVEWAVIGPAYRVMQSLKKAANMYGMMTARPIQHRAVQRQQR